MRKCPKCGTTYSDSDLRTMCSGCLVNLERVDNDAAMAEMATPGPISLGPITLPSAGPVELPSLPEITLPAPPPPTIGSIEMPQAPPPVLPDIPLPAPPVPRESDIPAPPSPPPTQTATPDLGVVVDEELNAEEQTLAELAATAPTMRASEPLAPPPVAVPPPAMGPEPPAPQMTAVTPPPPMGPDSAGPPPGPVSLDLELPPANPTPPPLQRSAPAPVPAAPLPVAPPTGWVSDEPAASPIAQRPLTPGAIGAANGRSGGFVFLAIVCGIIGLVTLFNTSGAEFNPFTIIVVGGMIALCIVCARKSIYYGAIESAQLTPLALPVLGSLLPVQVTIGVLKDLLVTDVEVQLVARERAVRRGGKSDSTFTHELYTQTARIPADATWAGGQTVTFTANLAIPADVPPSFAGRNNFIEWSLRLWVGIPGWYPDIRIALPVDVRPLLKNAPAPVIAEYTFAAPALPELGAGVTLQCATATGRPMLQAGSDVPVTVRINPAEAATDRRLNLELAYHVTGSGTGEDRNVAALACYPGGWGAGPQSMTGVLRIPTDVPISHDGLHVRIRWTLTLRLQAPWQFDKVQAYDVAMTPAALLTPEQIIPESPSERAAKW